MLANTQTTEMRYLAYLYNKKIDKTHKFIDIQLTAWWVPGGIHSKRV